MSTATFFGYISEDSEEIFFSPSSSSSFFPPVSYCYADLSNRLLLRSFLSFSSFLLVRARRSSNGGSYRRRVYTNDNLGHHAFMC